MSKALEDFEKMTQQIFQVDSSFEIYANKVKQHLLKAEEQEKLLNAIIKKNVNVWRFKADADIDYEYYKSNSILYHDVVHNNLLTEEEFNSLVTFISNLFQ